MVCKRYNKINHLIPNKPVVPRSFTLLAIIKYANAIVAKPIACFTGEIGSLPSARNLSHNILNGIASITTKIPLNICTIDGGIFHPKKFLSV